jgi:hypothetical protein
MYQSRTERAIVDVVAANSDEAEEFGTRMASTTICPRLIVQIPTMSPADSEMISPGDTR